jgi:hypothetical protein
VEDSADETHFPSIQRSAGGIFDGSVYILCIDKLQNVFKRRFKDFEGMKFIVSFQERDITDSAKLISSVFKKNMSALELEIINMQTDKSLKMRVTDKSFLEFSATCTVSCSKTSVVKGLSST